MNRCATYLAAALLATSAAALAQDKAGKYSARYDWTFDGKTFQFGKDRTIFVGNLPGVVHNDAGKGFPHNMRVDCQIMWDMTKGHSVANGTCLMTDAEGDQVYSDWKCEGDFPDCPGTFRMQGGSGKYTGISGGGKFNGIGIGNTGAGYSLWTGDWKLP